jgi:quercetin dioxygenase-like cupin family protein
MAGTTQVNLATTTNTELLEMGPIKIRILEDGSNTDNRIGAVTLTIAPHTSGPAMHWHRMHDETFLITKGKFLFHTGLSPPPFLHFLTPNIYQK